MKMRLVIVALVAGVLLAGCDFELPSQRRAREAAVRREAAAREEKEVEQTQAKSEYEVFKHYVGLQLSLAKSSRVETEKVLAELVADRKTMSARLAELSEKSMADKSGTRATALYALLKDEGLNALALRHLGSDFAVLRSEFAEKMRFAIKQEKARKTALDRNRAEYENAVAGGRNAASESRRAISENLAQIKREINEAENRLRHLRNNSLTITKADQANRDQAISAAERRLEQLKSQYTSILTSDRSSQQGRDADSAAASTRSWAAYIRERADKAVFDRTNGDVTSYQLSEEYEQLTIRRLDDVIQEKDRFARAQLKLIDEKTVFLQHVTNGIDRLNLAGLKRVRADVDALLAKSPETQTKKGEKR